MKKVVILSLTHGRGYGAERVLEYLMVAGKQILPGHVIIVCPEGSALAQTARELSYPWVAWESVRDSFFENFKALCRFLAKGGGRDARIFHGWTSRAFEWVILLAFIRGGVAMGSVHESPFAYFHRYFRKKLIRFGMNRLEKCAYVSRALIDLCGGPSRASVIIQNGLPDQPPKPRAEGNCIHIGFLGVNALGKGVEVLARTIDAMPDKNLRWHLYGNASVETEALLESIRNKKDERVIFRGFEPASKIFGELDIVFHPSTAFDAFPTVLIESARAGVPVVASRIGGVEEIVVDDRTGLIYEPADEKAAVEQLSELVRNREKRESLGREARRHFESKFRVDTMLNQYLSLWSISHGH